MTCALSWVVYACCDADVNWLFVIASSLLVIALILRVALSDVNVQGGGKLEREINLNTVEEEGRFARVSD